MKIFEKILLGFLILVFIGSLLIPVFIGSFSFYSFLDALTNTLLWGIPCLFVWVIVKIFIYFTKKKEKTEKTKKIGETEKVNKKIITLVLIFLIIINTIFWLNLTIKTLSGSEYYLKRELEKKGLSSVKGFNWSKIIKTTPTLTDEEYAIKRAVDRVFAIDDIENTITYRMIKAFEGKETILITFLIITDVVLIAIYFMIIPLYKKEKSDKQVYEKYLKDRKKEKDI